MGLHTCVFSKAARFFFFSINCHHLPFPSLSVTGSPPLHHGKHFHAQPQWPLFPNHLPIFVTASITCAPPPQPSTLPQMLALPPSTPLPDTFPSAPRCHSQPRSAAPLLTTNPSPQSLLLPNASLLASFLRPHRKASPEAFSYNPPFSYREQNTIFP